MLLRKRVLSLLNICLIAAIAALVVDVLLGVGSRYLCGAQVKWTEELATVLLIWVSFLGIAAAFEARAHLGIDILVGYFADKTSKRMSVFVHIVTFIFVLVVFEIGGFRLVSQALTHWNVLPALQVSDVIQFLPLPLSGLFILFFECCNLRDDLLKGGNSND